jgi:ATP-dependent RNA circularization protein (DNA/RNA ligase family)
MDFLRFPRTPHIALLGESHVRGDKVLSPAEAREFLAHEVIVEEKVDGANVGFSVDAAGELRAQNRGSFISGETRHAQFKPLLPWMEERRELLAQALASHLMLFGEWCFAVHSIRYARLPDWFLVFDVYDRARAEFWSAERRDALARQLRLSSVPRIAVGRFNLPGLQRLLGPSRLGENPAEGLHIRREEADRLVARAKLVRPEFLHSIEEHWTRRPLETNSLAKVGLHAREQL